ncbi:hypothetical protein BWI96_15890 [Siphonobacter sp. SORGH_AS_0500]|uniref:hypothetical protein n=1 Tax=Siphonobacter sp. SORGH_AS_0500 TaxID=1864824 RepID=UPI000CC60FCC|nr:hypothetical protein [Siphonobacter sp. SORGH_AS_0500]PKK35588.1 hypothetical protein BWI96_15890 [Siphonobacter sp. SORGH_AS_0500]
MKYKLFSKSSLFIGLTVLSGTLYSCQKEILKEEKASVLEKRIINDSKTGTIYDLNPNYRQLTPESKAGRGLLSSITDESGQIEVRVWEATSDAVSHPAVAVSVDQGFVVVGGGARAFNPNGSQDPNALLVESRPLNDGTYSTWVARSKDHDYVYPHKLQVYVVGVRMTGVSTSTLISNMSINENTSGVQSHSNTSVSVPNGYKLVGGGSRVNSQGTWGSLLFRSEPDASLTTWSSGGKDHIITSPSSVTAYAIGMKPSIPGFGTIDFSLANGYIMSNNSHILTTSTNVHQDKVLTCIGASTSWIGKGRMLFAMYPESNIRSITASSKDHKFADVTNATLSVQAIQIKKQ